MYKIAIIDDDPDFVDAISILLQSKGYSVVTAGNPNSAKLLVKEEKPDLIILDVMMEEPDDGFYLANRFRKDGVTIPIIMLTSISKVTGYDFGKSEMLPVDDFIEKPVPPDKLMERVGHFLKQS